MAKLAKALVLVDVQGHGLKAGQILEATPELIKALEKQGSVDPNKDAVAYAASQAAEEVRSVIELQAEADAAAAAAAPAPTPAPTPAPGT